MSITCLDNAFRRSDAPRRLKPKVLKKVTGLLLPSDLVTCDLSVTKKMSTARGWIVVINNPTVNCCYHLQHVKDDPRVLRFIGQTERGPENGVLHFQCYIEFKNSVRGAAVSKLVGGRSRNTKRTGTPLEAWQYCEEDAKDRLLQDDEDVSFRYGDRPPPGPGARTDIVLFAAEIAKGGKKRLLALDHPSCFLKYTRGMNEMIHVFMPKRARITPDIMVLWGPTGMGKTTYADSYYDEDVYWCQQGTNKNCWFTGYSGETVIIFDDFYGWCEYSFMLRLLDKFPLMLPVHGDQVPCNATKFIICSNVEPILWYPTVDSAALMRRLHGNVQHITEKMWYEEF